MSWTTTADLRAQVQRLWDRGDLALSGGIGFLDTDYDALSADNQFFGNLYRDREWWTFRLAASFTF